MLTSLKNLITSPVMGILTKTDNKQRKANESTSYYALKAENASSDKEFWMLFTAKEAARIPSVDSDLKGKLSQGRLYKMHPSNAKHSYYLCLVFIENKGDVILRLSNALVARAARRAERNIEDIPDQSWLSDLLD